MEAALKTSSSRPNFALGDFSWDRRYGFAHAGSSVHHSRHVCLAGAVLGSECLFLLPSISELPVTIIIPPAYMGRMVMEGGCPVSRAGIQALASTSSAYNLSMAPPCFSISVSSEGVWLLDAITARASAGRCKVEIAPHCCTGSQSTKRLAAPN